MRKRGLLTVTDGLLGAESGGSETTEMRHDDPEALCGEDGGDVGVAVDVVGPAVEQDDGLAVGRACVGVADAQVAGVDLFERGEGSSAGGGACGAEANRRQATSPPRLPLPPSRTRAC